MRAACQRQREREAGGAQRKGRSADRIAYLEHSLSQRVEPTAFDLLPVDDLPALERPRICHESSRIDIAGEESPDS